MTDKAIDAAELALNEISEPHALYNSGTAIRAAISAYLTQLEADGFVMVPVEPSGAMIDAFVSRALQVSIHGEGGWSEYGRNQWQQMIAASPQVKP